jgi:hypothetical protein
VIIATKFGFDIDPETKARRGFNSRPDHIKEDDLRDIGSATSKTHFAGARGAGWKSTPDDERS